RAARPRRWVAPLPRPRRRSTSVRARANRSGAGRHPPQVPRREVRQPKAGRWPGLSIVLPSFAAGLTAAPCGLILNRMVQHAQRQDGFTALSDPTRRGILERLGRGDASISDLAEGFDMTLTGIKKHVQILEGAGLVTTEKVGRVRRCRL